VLRKALVWWGLPLTRLEKDLRKELKNHGFWGHFGHGKGLRGWSFETEGLKIVEVQNK
jgi:hypothetical protein